MTHFHFSSLSKLSATYIPKPNCYHHFHWFFDDIRLGFYCTLYQRDMTYLRVRGMLNLKFKDHFSINVSADIHIAINRCVYQMMGVFCDRLKLCSTTAALNCQCGLAKTKTDIANKSSHSCLSRCSVCTSFKKRIYRQVLWFFSTCICM